MSALRSLDQRRAASAYATITAAPKKVAELAIRLPAMLQINGLLATWAFLLSQEGKGNPTPVGALLTYLQSLKDLKVPVGNAESVFLHWVGGAAGIGGSLLRALTAEALAWSGWLKRAAEAHGETGEGAGDV